MPTGRGSLRGRSHTVGNSSLETLSDDTTSGDTTSAARSPGCYNVPAPAMPLSSGTHLGPYEIVAAIGAGGMGEVYKARDTRLDRSVAIKVLPAHVNADPERRARFEREAKTIAGLNHSHICTLYDVGEHEGSTFLVMEHLTGETLAERLEKGPLPLEQALSIATEIADALSAAHRQGVIHRDLKPANVMLTKAGAKLLDFGLAKLKEHGEQPAAAHLAAAPTQSTPLTGEGMIVGTLQYMAPEQLEGKAADARTDLWALGAILYEMLSGKRAFEGTSAASLIGAILEREPAPISTLQPLTPPALDRLVRECLAKSMDDRADTAHDVAKNLRWVRETSGVGALTGARRRRGLPTALFVAGLIVAGILGAGSMWLLRPSQLRGPVAYLGVDVRPADELTAGGVSSIFLPTPGGSRTALTWTPDGQALVFVGRRAGVRQLYVRRLDAPEARPLAHTEHAQVMAVSPNGQEVAFWADGAIKKVPLGGGPAADLATGIAAPPVGMVWDSNGSLFFDRWEDDGRIWVIPPEAKPAAVTTVREGERTHSLPSLLPDGRVLLYTVRKRLWSWGDEEVVAQALPAGERKLLLTDAVDARYVPGTGHLVFLRRGVLYGVPFDPVRLQRRGPERPVLDGLAQALTASGGDVSGAGQFAVAPTGTFAWLPGPAGPYPQTRLVTVDRRGQVTALPAPEQSYGPRVRLSPDGRRLAVTVLTLTEVGLWVYDLTRPAPLLPLTTEGETRFPVWRPGGQELVFSWLNKGREALAAHAVGGTAPPRVLVSGDLVPSSFAPDGRLAAVAGGRDVVIVTVENGQARSEPLIQTPYTEQSPQFSPDGRWLLYVSDVTGRREVYVRPYPGSGEAVPVSVDGAMSPLWHPSGREIFFARPDDPAGKNDRVEKYRMMSAVFAPGSPQPVGQPKELFSFDQRDLRLACYPGSCYDIAPDGQRFYTVQYVTPPPAPVVTHINLITNWFDELKAKVPTGR